ncbi:alkaline phosphatase family protein [Planctomyces sp. SH-PL62]|uniref:alkaline phosphatase family protein n=1 Tax=Planctomyces sp. SH-PL62 TaxID=1636152 RepID=UPI00078DB81B|nr:alkaline phosphatase family protein [Planctomyces sp. SH-PL62]AMV39436.1 phosphoglyceromutase [Planctomyces sp. SH-PL62]
MPTNSSRVLFVGLDGGTRTILDPIFDRGWAPNLASLWRRSAVGRLRSTDPMVTPVAWTSFSTGCTPLTHGVHDFNFLDHSDGTIREHDATTVRTPTIWEVLSDLGGSVVSLGLPLTYPAPPVRGLFVAGADAPDTERAFGQCPEFGRRLRLEVPAYTNKLVWKRRPRTADEAREQADRCVAIFRAQAEAALKADGQVDWTAMMVHYHNLDSLQHRMWPYFDVDETGIREAGFTDAVERCVRELDASIGRLLELAAARDAAVVVVSDHGFGPCRSLVNVNGMLRAAGLQRTRVYGTRFRYRAIRLLERLRRWRALREPGAAAPAKVRPIDGQISCDWRRTVAFAPFGQLCGNVFLNREAVPGASADRALREIVALLKDARDPERGEKLFADVYATADRFGVDPAEQGMPDVFALSADGYQAQAKWSERYRNTILRPDPGLPATHWLDGVVAIDAPGVRPGPRLDACLHDVAPTSLAILGLEAPGFMEGRVLQDAFEAPPTLHRYETPNLVAADPEPIGDVVAAGVD